MIKASVAHQALFLYLDNLLTSFSADSFPKPIPAQEWIVVPQILSPATPVGAVLATLRGSYIPLRRLVISRRSTDFPVPVECHESPFAKRSEWTLPAAPVKFLPCFTRSKISFCSFESMISCSGGTGGGTSCEQPGPLSPSPGSAVALCAFRRSG